MNHNAVLLLTMIRVREWQWSTWWKHAPLFHKSSLCANGKYGIYMCVSVWSICILSVRMGEGRCALFLRNRKCKRCWALLAKDEVFRVQDRLSVKRIPRNFVLLTDCREECYWDGSSWSQQWSLSSLSWFCQTLRDRLLELYQCTSYFTSSL